MTLVRIIGADGAPMHTPWDGPLPAGAVVIPRMPEPFEVWIDGEWKLLDDEGLANWIAGPAHIAEARALKYLEALAIKGGAPLAPGLLAAEASDKGLSVAELADQVLEKRQPFIAAERLRQQRQSGAQD